MAFGAMSQSVFALGTWQLALLALTTQRDLVGEGARGLAGVVSVQEKTG